MPRSLAASVGSWGLNSADYAGPRGLESSRGQSTRSSVGDERQDPLTQNPSPQMQPHVSILPGGGLGGLLLSWQLALMTQQRCSDLNVVLFRHSLQTSHHSGRLRGSVLGLADDRPRNSAGLGLFGASRSLTKISAPGRKLDRRPEFPDVKPPFQTGSTPRSVAQQS
ncbi:hypothetical protein CIRG_06127 [Coccidioides immitis RMSCC 2394]|uniref:Uncharacterized protein n=1 Tax=Coccidioides immitis RMSCC 2394 TaxID=404692 RepID=A0A0J6YCI7_COCIT|nr:hypothetical protein CIRG_06127 [Coccidioides immitis RMSCC 2394]